MKQSNLFPFWIALKSLLWKLSQKKKKWKMWIPVKCHAFDGNWSFKQCFINGIKINKSCFHKNSSASFPWTLVYLVCMKTSWINNFWAISLLHSFPSTWWILKGYQRKKKVIFLWKWVKSDPTPEYWKFNQTSAGIDWDLTQNIIYASFLYVGQLY